MAYIDSIKMAIFHEVCREQFLQGLKIGFIESTLLASYADSQYQNINPKAVLVGAWAGTTLGGVIGGLLAHKRPISPARASLIESTAIRTGILSMIEHHSITSGDTDNKILLTTSAHKCWCPGRCHSRCSD